MDRTNPCSYLVLPPSPWLQHQHNHVTSVLLQRLRHPSEGNPSSGASEVAFASPGWREGKVMLKAAVPKCSQGEIALPRLQMAPPFNCKQAKGPALEPSGSLDFAIVKLPLLCRHKGRKETQSGVCLKSLPES